MTKTTKPYRGWLKNPQRKDRQGKSLAFNEDHVRKLIEDIEETPQYVSEILGSKIDKQIRLRDKALISTGWIWFKRASEILGVKRKEVYVDEQKIYITFHIRKKSKRYKICPTCLENGKNGKEARSGFKANFCRTCKTDLQNVEIQGGTEEFTKTKNMTLKFDLTKYIVEWLHTFDEISLEDGIHNNDECWFFPSFQVFFNEGGNFNFFAEKPMTLQNFDNILQKLDPTITSSFFRYFRTEQLQVRGYTNEELKQIGDWSSSHMPEIYAKRRNLTPALRRFGENR